MSIKNKNECNIFRDLYKGYSYDEVEEDTLMWMKSHEEKCNECRAWIRSIKEKSDESLEDIQCVKEAKNIMFIGIGLVVFLSIWICIWLFI
ncbi:hypothetical protein [Clostridium massiliodielmoense]|uniref:hypothetical protein n=1 Tax=Clostridium massiliodielmoense TaxID=1776385 RepID=UPI000166A28A|nr:hypothetical protein [Clostridium massiliodielmoense]EDS78679.1 conserved hypothetical protein [Clostridium botulinum C str. Eklund]KEH97311.1 hypothetical protein Z962_04095 [Clostridium botulinum C/D str. BKT12695]NEZ49202.1 hypothetical protein [Clostridium botulinum]